MILRVEYTGQLQSAVGRAGDEVELSETATIGSLLEHLGNLYQDSVERHLRSPGGGWQLGMLIAVNGTAMPSRNAIGVPLNPGDVVTLLPPIGGG